MSINSENPLGPDGNEQPVNPPRKPLNAERLGRAALNLGRRIVRNLGDRINELADNEHETPNKVQKPEETPKAVANLQNPASLIPGAAHLSFTEMMGKYPNSSKYIEAASLGHITEPGQMNYEHVVAEISRVTAEIAQGKQSQTEKEAASKQLETYIQRKNELFNGAFTTFNRTTDAPDFVVRLSDFDPVLRDVVLEQVNRTTINNTADLVVRKKLEARTKDLNELEKYIYLNHWVRTTGFYEFLRDERIMQGFTELDLKMKYDLNKSETSFKMLASLIPEGRLNLLDAYRRDYAMNGMLLVKAWYMGEVITALDHKDSAKAITEGGSNAMQALGLKDYADHVLFMRFTKNEYDKVTEDSSVKVSPTDVLSEVGTIHCAHLRTFSFDESGNVIWGNEIGEYIAQIFDLWENPDVMGRPDAPKKLTDIMSRQFETNRGKWDPSKPKEIIEPLPEDIYTRTLVENWIRITGSTPSIDPGNRRKLPDDVAKAMLASHKALIMGDLALLKKTVNGLFANPATKYLDAGSFVDAGWVTDDVDPSAEITSQVMGADFTVRKINKSKRKVHTISRPEGNITFVTNPVYHDGFLATGGAVDELGRINTDWFKFTEAEQLKIVDASQSFMRLNKLYENWTIYKEKIENVLANILTKNKSNPLVELHAPLRDISSLGSWWNKWEVLGPILQKLCLTELNVILNNLSGDEVAHRVNALENYLFNPERLFSNTRARLKENSIPRDWDGHQLAAQIVDRLGGYRKSEVDTMWKEKGSQRGFWQRFDVNSNVYSHELFMLEEMLKHSPELIKLIDGQKYTWSDAVEDFLLFANVKEVIDIESGEPTLIVSEQPLVTETIVDGKRVLSYKISGFSEIMNSWFSKDGKQNAQSVLLPLQQGMVNIQSWSDLDWLGDEVFDLFLNRGHDFAYMGSRFEDQIKSAAKKKIGFLRPIIFYQATRIVPVLMMGMGILKYLDDDGIYDFLEKWAGKGTRDLSERFFGACRRTTDKMNNWFEEKLKKPFGLDYIAGPPTNIPAIVNAFHELRAEAPTGLSMPVIVDYSVAERNLLRQINRDIYSVLSGDEIAEYQLIVKKLNRDSGELTENEMKTLEKYEFAARSIIDTADLPTYDRILKKQESSRNNGRIFHSRVKDVYNPVWIKKGRNSQYILTSESDPEAIEGLLITNQYVPYEDYVGIRKTMRVQRDQRMAAFYRAGESESPHLSRRPVQGYINWRRTFMEMVAPHTWEGLMEQARYQLATSDPSFNELHAEEQEHLCQEELFKNPKIKEEYFEPDGMRLLIESYRGMMTSDVADTLIAVTGCFGNVEAEGDIIKFIDGQPVIYQNIKDITGIEDSDAHKGHGLRDRIHEESAIGTELAMTGAKSFVSVGQAGITMFIKSIKDRLNKKDTLVTLWRFATTEVALGAPIVLLGAMNPVAGTVITSVAIWNAWRTFGGHEGGELDVDKKIREIFGHFKYNPIFDGKSPGGTYGPEAKTGLAARVQQYSTERLTNLNIIK